LFYPSAFSTVRYIPRHRHWRAIIEAEIRFGLGERDGRGLEKKDGRGLEMKQDEQERVNMLLSEIQSILTELPPIQKTGVEQTNAPAMVVSQFGSLNERPTAESKSAIPLMGMR
jgi:hypothetical protein